MKKWINNLGIWEWELSLTNYHMDKLSRHHLKRLATKGPTTLYFIAKSTPKARVRNFPNHRTKQQHQRHLTRILSSQRKNSLSNYRTGIFNRNSSHLSCSRVRQNCAKRACFCEILCHASRDRNIYITCS